MYNLAYRFNAYQISANTLKYTSNKLFYRTDGMDARTLTLLFLLQSANSQSKCNQSFISCIFCLLGRPNEKKMLIKGKEWFLIHFAPVVLFILMLSRIQSSLQIL